MGRRKPVKRWLTGALPLSRIIRRFGSPSRRMIRMSERARRKYWRSSRISYNRFRSKRLSVPPYLYPSRILYAYRIVLYKALTTCRKIPGTFTSRVLVTFILRRREITVKRDSHTVTITRSCNRRFETLVGTYLALRSPPTMTTHAYH